MTQTRQVGSGVPALSIRYAEESHIGLRKKEQQDYQGRVYITPEAHPAGPMCVFVVCDGVSMGMAGALASRTAVEVTLEAFPTLLNQGYKPLQALKTALEQANAAVVQLSLERPGMATTCVATLLVGNQLYSAHVGDSRAYLSRLGQAPLLLTTDHSWTEEIGRTMVRQGLMSDDELRRDGRRHAITRAMGLDDNISFDFNQQTIYETDRVLLCSDGLWDAIEDDVLYRLITNEQGNQSQTVLPQVTHEMIEAALQAGGRDNITVSLLEIDETGPNDVYVALDNLVEETRHNTQLRTGLASEEIDQSEIPTVQIQLPNHSETLPTQVSPGFQINEDALFQRAQKLYALGDFKDALEQMLDLEQLNSERNGLHEMMNNSLIRVVAAAVQRGDLSYVTHLFEQMTQLQLTRYREMLFDFCMQESQEAEQARNYGIIRDYAKLALLLHPSDNRPRHLQDLSETYLYFQKDDLPLQERLNIGQNLYARDPDFGGIQDDLARIYLELGDAAVAQQAENEAIDWYQLVRGLRPHDSRIYSLAIGKQRALEDTLQRRALQEAAQKEFEFVTPVVEDEASTSDPTKNVNRAYETEKIEQDLDGINRLKERVSRTQKAWDNGRREIGGEYIYLVEQLSKLLSPNPWQPTYPRVCYDYGKWLFEQHQYREARPYLEKARDLGVGVAQQKLREIERLEDDGETVPSISSSRPLHNQTSYPSAARVAAEPDTHYQGEANRVPTNQFNGRQPFIAPMVETNGEGEKNFVGATHAGDGVLNPNRSLPLQSPATPTTVAPFDESQGVADSGSNYPLPADEYAVNSPTRRAARYLKAERSVGATGLRTPVNATTNKSLQTAVARELSRLNTTGVPQYVAPKQAARRRASGLLDLVRFLWLPLLLGLLVIAAIATLAYTLLNSKPQPVAEVPTVVPSTATVLVMQPSVTPTFAPATETPLPTPVVVQPHVNVKLNGAGLDNYNLYLGLQATGLKNLLPLSLTDKTNGVFSLSQGDVNKIDRSQAYFVLARPKDTPTRKYRADLPLNDPRQAIFVQSSLTFDVGYTIKANFNVPVQAAEFYPLDLGANDGDAPGGGRYFSVTQHIVRPAFLDFYQQSGDLNRWGYPLSEEFDWSGVGHVQFFERGWFLKNSDGTVGMGDISKTLLAAPCAVKPGPVLPPTDPSITVFNTASSFAAFVTKNNLGKPVSEFFFLDGSDKVRRLYQYFEYGRLEVAQTAPNLPIDIGLTGSEYARCQGWIN